MSSKAESASVASGGACTLLLWFRWYQTASNTLMKDFPSNLLI